MQFDFSWPVRKIPLNEQVDHLTYSTTSGTYVVGTTRDQDFKLPDDDELHPEWRNEGKLAFTFPHLLSYEPRLTDISDISSAQSRAWPSQVTQPENLENH